MLDAIVSTKVVRRYKRFPGRTYVDGIVQSGEDLRMSDGSLWFHPYDGGAPRLIEAPNQGD